MNITSYQKKLGAIVIVALIVIGAGAIYLLAGSDDSQAEKFNSELLIYGNANGDLVIDNKDVNIIQDIIDGKRDFSDYPMADANQDGKIDEADLTVVKALIAGNNTTVYVKCLNSEGEAISVAVSYPMKNVVPFGTNIVEPFLYVGGGEYVAGYFSSTYPNQEASMTGAVDLKGSSREITDAAWQNFMQLDADLQDEGGVGALLIDHSAKSFSEDRLKDLNAANIPVIRYASADQVQEIATALTLGFLCGKTTEAMGLSYAESSLEIYNAIQNKVKDLNDDERATVINFTMWIFVCQNDSTFNQSPEYVGAVPYYKTNSDFKADYTGSRSSKMQTVDALANYDDADYLINNRSLDIGQTDMNSVIVEQWEKNMQYFENLDNYHNLVYVNNILPGSLRLAYMAAAIYPDLFTKEWADGYLQTFIDAKYTPLVGQTLETICTSFGYEDYIAAKG